jgi:hypothetical protein
MQYDTRAILAIIANAINPKNPEGTQYGERIISHTVLAELETTPDQYGLTIYMADGRQFQITVEEVV